MRLTQLIAAAAALAMVTTGGPAVAQGYDANADIFAPTFHSYVGAWPVTITNSQFSNGTGCLTLNGNDLTGQASLVFGGFKYPYGSYIVLNHILMVTITEPLYGQNGDLLFVAPATRVHPGEGIFEDARGGSNFDFGSLAFGARNRC
ncbi:MAG: hypothetical protein JO113_07720 [Candidatus Eremiobacteraeota bacterium]|nr:hypothetical protein [Candidatus Eremiobacteraeota bacterium]